MNVSVVMGWRAESGKRQWKTLFFIIHLLEVKALSKLLMGDLKDQENKKKPGGAVSN